MVTAKRLDSLIVSVIREMTRVAIEHDAINLAQGFPEFDPPEEVIAAAEKALRSGQHQYTITWGTKDLCAALSQKYAAFYDMQVDPDDHITVTNGVTEAVVAAMFAILDPGDKIIIPEPAHENYNAGAIFTGAIPIKIPLRPPGFYPDHDDLRAAFKQNPKAIIVNTPHNPGGRVLTPKTLQLIADLCIEHNVIAITDEIYEHIIYDDNVHIPLATLSGMAERTITTSGLSKTYAATGWRIGWVIAPSAISDAIRKVKDYLTICAPAPLQAGAAVALRLPMSFYDQVKIDYTARRDRLMAILDGAGFVATPPEGAYYVMADFSRIQPDMDAVEFANWLTIKKKVAIVPGNSFYKDPQTGAKLVRFAFPKTMATLDLVAERLSDLGN